MIEWQAAEATFNWPITVLGKLLGVRVEGAVGVALDAHPHHLDHAWFDARRLVALQWKLTDVKEVVPAHAFLAV